eukprot:CAMPEP_0172773470 /NCGR_PEP_ID=MMETSP1074-20121228/194359_1 /TAXON_ID=2916 /ORGANISM="Ceratium fusus, Strain PA161109" /LENGTH=46 /DNA_ID= /DNA_START= /DNA_END= /DNA_ORIENTATION=
MGKFLPVFLFVKDTSHNVINLRAILYNLVVPQTEHITVTIAAMSVD